MVRENMRSLDTVRFAFVCSFSICTDHWHMQYYFVSIKLNDCDSIGIVEERMHIKVRG